MVVIFYVCLCFQIFQSESKSYYNFIFAGELFENIKKLDSQLVDSLKSHKNDMSIKKFLPLIMNSSAQKEYENLFIPVSNGNNFGGVRRHTHI